MLLATPCALTIKWASSGGSGPRRAAAGSLFVQARAIRGCVAGVLAGSGAGGGAAGGAYLCLTSWATDEESIKLAAPRQLHKLTRPVGGKLEQQQRCCYARLRLAAEELLLANGWLVGLLASSPPLDRLTQPMHSPSPGPGLGVGLGRGHIHQSTSATRSPGEQLARWAATREQLSRRQLMRAKLHSRTQRPQ